VTLRLAETRAASPTLVPEVTLHLLTPDSPHWHASDPEALGWPYWAVAWPGGQALARYVLDHPDLVRGRRVLDFGSGGAVEGLAAAKAGAASVLCADVDPLAAEAARANAVLNGVRLAAHHARAGAPPASRAAQDAAASFAPALATTTEDLVGAPRGAWDVVLAGDVCFEPAFAARVIAWLRALAGQGCLVLLGDPSRVALPADALLDLAAYDAPHDGDLRALTRWTTRVARVLPARP
jgi:predicted nicotinamide N-methyase